MATIQNKIVNKPYFRTVYLLLLAGLGCICCTTTPEKKTGSESITTKDNDLKHMDYLYQYSIIDALLAGVYDGDLSVGQLRTKGSLGVGGFNHLDGELYMNEGEVYKIRYDGSVHKVPDADRIPIAFVKHFQPDTTLTLVQKGMDYEGFRARLQSFLDQNELYAIRISGSFPKVLARAPAPAEKPYPPLAEHLKEHQHGFGLKHTRGTGVGFYLPEYMGKVNIPGFHFHYLSEENRSGGHVLDFVADSLYVEIDRASGFVVQFPDNRSFRRADLQKDREKEVEKIE
ncbi:acetolactate decarboxylase [Sinomicrobium weinanense]|uniref:Alpha-acetolactate decarboxylase n=1 Tax=Sinomicrobium weinanense TaxID=2842200 RepID=A0A926JUN0_9FLAO|nr:acetolactate decarboxylase [Sinomicrobium weinanense]MBC9797553.1 acetolactate decarboxylase [Sinomicrobium weinanense]MBU3123908.1 acetolactate decarboxylase [Sinomicrobium weinanense]